MIFPCIWYFTSFHGTRIESKLFMYSIKSLIYKKKYFVAEQKFSSSKTWKKDRDKDKRLKF